MIQKIINLTENSAPQIRLPETHERDTSTQKSTHTFIDGKKSKRRGALTSHWSSGTNNRRNTATRETLLAWNEPTGKYSQNKGPRRLSRKTVDWHVTLPIIFLSLHRLPRLVIHSACV
jgi:hypothetical protein